MSSSTLNAAMDRPDDFGPYKVLDVLGEGGMGVVYLAEQKTPIRRQVALKVIKLGMDTREVLARFDAERNALALMDHPNIAKVLDAGCSQNGRPFFVMELVKGVPITDYCDRHKLDIEARQRLFLQVCHGLQHAHDRGVIHRDIKPQNVFVTLVDGQPFVKIIDFGVAKATNQRLTEKTIFTEQGRLIGTPEYMSPEQAEMTGLDVDERTDVYSLGVLLYEILTGTLPFDAQELRRAGYLEIQRRIREVVPPTPSKRVSTLGATADQVAAVRNCSARSLRVALQSDLDWIVMTALAKDRTKRYASPSDLAADVERHLGGEVVVAKAAGWFRAGWLGRRKLLAVLAAAALAGVSWISVSGYQRCRSDGLREKVEAMFVGEDVPLALARMALDEQRACLDADNAEMIAAGLRPLLLSEYEKTLVHYVQRLFNDHVEERSRDISGRLDLLPGEKFEDPAVQRRFREGDQQLSGIEQGLQAFLSRAETERLAAQRLWEQALNDTSQMSRAHFAHAFEMKPSFAFAALEGSLRVVRERLRHSLAAGERADLERAAGEDLQAFFPRTWAYVTETRTAFGQLSALDSRGWSAAVRAVDAVGPLFPKRLSTAGSATVDQLLELLAKDVEGALGKVGTSTNRPLRSMANGGWEQTVAKKRSEFLAKADASLDLGWQTLLDQLCAVADAGNDAKGEGRSGHERTDILPELVNAYHVARATFEAGRPLTDDEYKTAVSSKKVKHDPGTPPWIENSDSDGSIAASVKRAEAAAKFADQERDRIFSQKWDVSLLNERFCNFEYALVESICRREWRACRDDIERFAAIAPRKVWNQMLAGYPFTGTAAAEATAGQIGAAIAAMMELADAIESLAPKSEFELAPDFAADLEAARELRRMLYGSDVVTVQPNISFKLCINGEGDVANVRIAGEVRAAEGPRSTEYSWSLGPAESLAFSILMANGDRASLSDILDANGGSIAASWMQGNRLVPGMWGVKRLFSLGVTVATGASERRATLRMRGRSDSAVLLFARTDRAEAAELFDNRWPGDRYQLSNTMWKHP